MKEGYIKTGGSGERPTKPKPEVRPPSQKPQLESPTWAGMDAVASQRDKYRAVLEGADYDDIDEMANLTVEECRVIGMAAKLITMNIIKERDILYKKLMELMRASYGLQGRR